MQRRRIGALLGAAALGVTLPAWAQRSRLVGRILPGEIELTVPFSAGGNSALLAKSLVRQFTKEMGQPMHLKYRDGAGGTVGASYVAKAAPDGLHLLMGGPSMLVSRAMLLQLDVDLYEDFVPLALVAEMPQVLLVNPRRLNTRTWPELLAELRRRHRRYRYASAGIGSSTHVLGEWFKHESGALLQHMPYKGSGPAMLGVAQGNAELMFDGLGSALPHLQADRLRAVFVTSPERSPRLPDVPTSSELGLHNFQSHAWCGIFAPKATPGAVCERLIEAFRLLSQAPEVLQEWQALGARWPGLYGADFSLFLKDEMKRWADIVRAVGTVARP